MNEGCLNSISVYKLALARLEDVDVKNQVVEMISKLEKDDPMRKGRYQEWRISITSQ
jgi:hypothetical protein